MCNLFSVEPEIIVNPRSSDKPFVLNNEVCYTSDLFDNNKYIISLEKGYIWDGATIPKFLWRVVGSQYNPEFLPASMIHDWLCEHKDFIPKKGAKISSDIFRDILILYKVPTWKANIMAAAVRCYQSLQKGWK